MEEQRSQLSRTGTSILMIAVFLIVRTLLAIAKPGHLNNAQATWLTFGIVLVMMLLQLGLVQSVVRIGLRPKQSALWALLCAVAFVGMFFLLAYAMRAVKGYGHLEVVSLLIGIHQLSLMLLAVFLGITVSYIIREPNTLLPVAIVAAAVDFWNVYVGPLGHIVATKPGVVHAVTIQMPAPVPGMPIPMIGMGDFVFLAMYFSVVCRFGLNIRGTFWWGYVLLTLTMLAVLGPLGGVPALVPMAFAVIIPNIRHIHLKRDELLATIGIGVVVLILLGASGYYMLRHHPIPKPPQVHDSKPAHTDKPTLNPKH